MGKSKKKTATKSLPQRAPYRKTCTTCGNSWLGNIIYSCGHDTIVETDIVYGGAR